MNAEKQLLASIVMLLAASPLCAQTIVISHGQVVDPREMPPTSFAKANGLDKTYASIAVASMKSRPVQDVKMDVLNEQSNMCTKHVDLNNLENPSGVDVPVPCAVQHPFLEKDSAIGAVFSACDGYGDTENNAQCETASFWFPDLTTQGNNVLWNGQVVAKVHKGLISRSLKLEKGFKFVPKVRETGYVDVKNVRAHGTSCPQFLNPTENNICAVPEVPISYVDHVVTPVTLVQVDLVADASALKSESAQSAGK